MAKSWVIFGLEGGELGLVKRERRVLGGSLIIVVEAGSSWILSENERNGGVIDLSRQKLISIVARRLRVVVNNAYQSRAFRCAETSGGYTVPLRPSRGEESSRESMASDTPTSSGGTGRALEMRGDFAAASRMARRVSGGIR